MERKQLILLAVCSATISMLMAMLYVTSSLSKEIPRAGFERNFIADPLVTVGGVLKLPYNSYYIAGVGTNAIYLGNRTDPLHMVIIHTPSFDTLHVKLDIYQDKTITAYSGFTLKVDSPYFFLLNGSLPGIIRGNVGEWKARQMVADWAYFVDAEPIGASSFVMRAYSMRSQGFELAKQIADRPDLEFNYDILEKQIDGIFCVTGMLHYSRQLESAIYVYAYRNQYMVVDSSLNLTCRANTIDTFSHAPIRTAHIESDRSNLLASPPNVINRRSAVDGTYLYVNSNILAKNEDLQDFLNASVIDVYDLVNGSYQCSFHLPDYQGMPLTDLRIFDRKMVLLHDQYVMLMKFRPGVLDN